MCSRYFTTEGGITKHLRLCVNVANRIKSTFYDFPLTNSGQRFCPICGMEVKTALVLAKHLVKKHENEQKELKAWGYDVDLIHAQFCLEDWHYYGSKL